MDWKNWPAWKKGAIIGIIFGVIISVLDWLFIGLLGWYACIALVIYFALIGLIIDKNDGPISAIKIAIISFLIPWLFFIIGAGIIIMAGISSGEGMVGIILIPLSGMTLLVSLISIPIGIKLNYKAAENGSLKNADEPRRAPSKTKAIIALVLNIALPGLGSIIGGKKLQGILQLLIFIAIYLTTTFMTTSLGLDITILSVMGEILRIAIWVWGIITGIQIIKESTKN